MVRDLWISGIQSGLDGFGHMLSQKIIPLILEMTIQGRLIFAQMRRDCGEEIVHRDLMLFHDFGSGLIVLHDGSGNIFLLWVVGNGSGAGPDELGSGLLESLDDGFQSLRVSVKRGLPVVNPKVKMDDIPFSIP